MTAPFYVVMQGMFVIPGYEPDGDSVRFIPTNPEHFVHLKNFHRIKPSRRDGSVQLRFQGVDAPELHYGSAAQPMGAESRDALLGWMGFQAIEYGPPPSTKVVSAVVGSIPGAILTQASDPHGRPIAYVLLQDRAGTFSDGTWHHLTTDLLKHTINYRLLTSGMAYYLGYNSIPLVHRQALRAAALAARQQNLGVWALDMTPEFDPTKLAPGPEGQLIFPKLFRRATDYLRDVNTKGFQGNLQDWIIAISQLPSRDENDRALINNDQTEVHLSDLLEQHNSRVAFQADTLDLTFIER